MKYSELIPAMLLLYEQLIACHPHNMLNISSASLKFISQERFSNCCRWPEEVLQNYAKQWKPNTNSRDS